MKGLLIAYSFGPQKNVGALRPTYWAEEISQQYEDFHLDVITEVAGETSQFYNRIVVENKSSSIWSFLIKDEGLTWRRDLKKRMQSMDLQAYDFAIITGGPFFHFSIAKYLKDAGLKVILDYRDPFSYNPRFNDKGLKKWIKKWFERKFLRAADLVLTVNEACHEYIGNDVNITRGILPNGFDERCIDERLRQEKVSSQFFYAGRFYWIPEVLFDVLKENELDLVHAGPSIESQHPFIASERYSELGMLDQADMYKALAKAEIGIVFTMDIPFESTTKIYDYIGLNRKILIITKGTPGKGVLNRELQHYPFYQWVSYDKEAIRKAISDLLEMEVTSMETEKFSRKEGLRILVNYICDVCDK